jgi:hypothetical protein
MCPLLPGVEVPSRAQARRRKRQISVQRDPAVFVFSYRRCSLSSTTRAPCRSVIRAVGQRATAAR